MGLIHSPRARSDYRRRLGCGATQFRELVLIEQFNLFVHQVIFGAVVLDLQLLGHEGGEDRGIRRRIFVANLFERVEALAAALVVWSKRALKLTSACWVVGLRRLHYRQNHVSIATHS